MQSEIQPSGYVFIVMHNMGGGVRRPIKFQLLGGYAIDRTTIVIYRDPTGGGGPGGGTTDGLLELRRNDVVRPVGPRGPAIDLMGGDLARFDLLPDHYQFLLKKRWWRKLPIEKLAQRMNCGWWHTA